MRFGSVCSGIEAASVAWEPLGWKAAWLAEIEPFPSAVLAHHYPSVPNLGDMTKLPERIVSGEVEAPDLFCGGTPCQAFSVAGLRKSLDDARGNLSLTFCEIANAIDVVRLRAGKPASIVFWENVPGVLSTQDNAFGCFLAGLAGEDDPIEPPGKKWTNAGCVIGPQRAVAWRVLDAQYFGVAQRRKRVFVVASARNDFDPAAVLFEWDGLRRDFAPSREAREGTAPSTEPSIASGKQNVGTLMANAGTKLWLGNQEALSGDYHILQPTAFALQHAQIGRCIATREGSSQDWESTTMVAHSLTASRSSTQCPNEDATLVPVSFSIMPMNSGKDFKGRETDIAQPLMAGGPVGGNQGGDFIVQPLAFHPTQDPISSTDGTTHAMGCGSSGGTATVAVAFDLAQITSAANRTRAEPGLPASTMSKGSDMHVATSMQVRRLTPVECERLQGFPDGYTAIPWRGKPADQCPDGPRYKALGNSWAVPNVRWIGRRIALAVEVAKERLAA